MRTQLSFALLAAAAACTLATAPAHARARVFVASYGSDSNPCTFGSPCKTFQHAHDVVDAAGEVTAIDSAGFGPINITKAVTITSPDGVEAGIVPTSGGNAITINAGANDAIALRGLTLNGSGLDANGVVFNSGGSLTVDGCVAQNFVQNGSGGAGILIESTSGTSTAAITNTSLKNNTFGFIVHPSSGSPTVNVAIDHVVATNNGDGLQFDGLGSALDVAISNTIASGNDEGIVGSDDHVTISIDNTTINGNNIGLNWLSGATVLLSRSVIQGNNTGIANSTPNTFYTYGNNLIDLNGTNFFGAALNTTVRLR